MRLAELASFLAGKDHQLGALVKYIESNLFHSVEVPRGEFHVLLSEWNGFRRAIGLAPLEGFIRPDWQEQGQLGERQDVSDMRF